MIGIRLHDTAPGTLCQRARSAGEQGFECVQLALSKVLGIHYIEPENLTEALAGEVSADLGSLSVAVLGCYLNLAHPDEAAYRRTLARYLAHVRMTKWLGATCLGTETGNPNADYHYDPRTSHTEESLQMFIRRLEPVVREAEAVGATVAIEPVYTHIVCDAKRARRVLDALASPSLRIILDPVNLLCADDFDRRDAIVGDALSLLWNDTVAIHAKDAVRKGDAVESVAVGLGDMDWAPIMRLVARERPAIPVLLEDTTPQTAPAARLALARLLDEAR